MITRRHAFSGLVALPILAGCTTARRAVAMDRLKQFSQKFTDFAVDKASIIPGSAGVIADILANNVQIQAATDLRAVERVYLLAVIDAGDKLLELAKFAPIPSSIIATANIVLDVLRAGVGLIPDEPSVAKSDAAAAALAAHVK